MSGHSKWATIKRKKGAIDQKRGKLFAKLSRQIEVAVREGGSGDTAANATLRTIVAKAKAAQMTNEAIDRAIKRALGGGNRRRGGQRLPVLPAGRPKAHGHQQDTGTDQQTQHQKFAPCRR